MDDTLILNLATIIKTATTTKASEVGRTTLGIIKFGQPLNFWRTQVALGVVTFQLRLHQRDVIWSALNAKRVMLLHHLGSGYLTVYDSELGRLKITLLRFDWIKFPFIKLKNILDSCTKKS